jgi:hypothetical protein
MGAEKIGLDQGGYEGQYTLANPDAGVIVVFFGVSSTATRRLVGRGDPHGGEDH